MTGQIPQSTALSEALPDSLSELYSRDPEGFQRQDRDAIVRSLRAQRERLRAAELAGGPTRAKKTAGVKTEASTPGTTTASSGDLGF